MRIVMKFGGSSLADAGKIRSAAKKAALLWRQGHQVIVTVSAQADTTDTLLRNAAEFAPEACLREQDAYLAAGEQMSAALMAMALNRMEIPAVSLTGPQAGILTDGNYGNARVLGLCKDRIRQELERGNAVVAAGFQGMDPAGNLTTLGRGGSDTTAVALAAFLNADACLIYTDVDGVYDRDPRIFPDAVKYDRLSWQEMLRLTRGGARVLHDRAAELAEKYGVRIRVLSSFRPGAGTEVGDFQENSSRN